MSILKYKVTFKRILIAQAMDKGRPVQMRVGEVDKFQQNPDGSLDVVAYLWPQTPQKLKEQLEKNPALMGMTAETNPITDALVFPDGTEFEEGEDPYAEEMNKLKELIKSLQDRVEFLEGKDKT